MVQYIVVKCRNCGYLTYIRSTQKSATCRKCKKKNSYNKLEYFPKASLAAAYIQEYKLRNSDFDGGFRRVA